MSPHSDARHQEDQEESRATYFIPGEGVDKLVLIAYLGSIDGEHYTVRVSHHPKDPDRTGYIVNTCSILTKETVEDLQVDTKSWLTEQESSEFRRRPYDYLDSITFRSRRKNGPTQPPRHVMTTFSNGQQSSRSPSRRARHENENAVENSSSQRFSRSRSRSPMYVDTETVQEAPCDRLIGHKKVRAEFLKPYNATKNDEQDAVSVSIGDFTASAFVDSGATSDFISQNLVNQLKERVGTRPRGSTEYQGATGERLTVVGTVHLHVSWSDKGERKSDWIAFNVADGLVFDVIISADTAEGINMDHATRRVTKRNLIGTVAPIRPVSSTQMPRKSETMSREDQRKAEETKRKNAADDRLRKQSQMAKDTTKKPSRDRHS